jgi:hypothetical protein
MSRSATSIFVFGIYLVCIGAAFLLAPNLLLSIANIPETQDVWAHLVGFLLLVLSFYYLMGARQRVTAFYRWTLYTRLGAIFFLVGFVLADLTGPVVFLFWLGDLAGAIWTWWALRKDEADQAAAQ